jgi:hypothetical protein
MVVISEAIFGMLLLTRVFPQFLWYGAVLSFSLFASISAVEAFLGTNSCGCFGPLQVPPIYTILLDALLLGLLLWTGRPHAELDSRAKLRVIAFTCFGLFWFSAMTGIWYTRPRTAGNIGEVHWESGTLVVLESEEWEHKKFALCDYIEGGSQLRSGRWIVLLVHHDCDHCAQAVSHFLAQVKLSNSPRLAVIELPPLATSSEDVLWSLPPNVFASHLDSAHEWFGSTPIALLVDDGIVVAAREGDRASTPEATWLQP